MKRITKKCFLIYFIIVITYVNTIPVLPAYAADAISVDCRTVKKLGLKGFNSGSWTQPKEFVFKVDLNKGMNTIKFTNAAYYAPYIDLIAVSKKTFK